MIIVHVSLCDQYAEGWGYHRNIISTQNAKDGNQVFLIANRYSMDEDGKAIITHTGTYTNKYGIKVIRLDDRITKNKTIQSRLRLVSGLYKTLSMIKPDIIWVHNTQFFSLPDVVKYKKENRKTLLIGDSHADYIVSGRNFVSKYILNGLFYRVLQRKYIKYFDYMIFPSSDTKVFFEERYTRDLPCNEVIPLCSLYCGPDEKDNHRKEFRAKYNIGENQLILVHSGKLDSRKKTKELLEAFYCASELNAQMFICGSIPENMKNVLIPLIERDERVHFLGWKKNDEMTTIIAAADLYFQPGMHSVTLQNSLSCGTPVVVGAGTGYEQYFSGWELVYENQESLDVIFEGLNENKYDLKKMSLAAYNAAAKYFDSRIQAKLMYKMLEELRGSKK